MLALGVVYCHHREFQQSFSVKSLQSDNACSGLLTSAPYLFSKVRSLFVYHGNKVRSVVDDYVWLMFKAHFDVSVVFLLSGTVVCINSQTAICKGCSHIVLSAEHVASRHGHICSAGCQHQTEIGRLGFKMHGKGNLHSLKRFSMSELLLKPSEERHIFSYPFNFLMAGGRQRNVSYIVILHFSSPLYCICGRRIFFAMQARYSTVTDLARFFGLSILQPLSFATKYEKSCSGTTESSGVSSSRQGGM